MISLLALYPVVRGVIFVGLLVLIGTVAARRLAVRTILDPVLASAITRRVAAIVPPITLLLVLVIAVRGALQVISFLDPGDRPDWTLIHGALLSGSWGIAWMVQLASAATLAIASRVPPARNGVAPTILLLPIIGAQTMMGHPSGSQWPGPTGQLLDAAHIIGAGIWLGTLTVIATRIIPVLRHHADQLVLPRLVERYSLYARTGVAMIVVSGTTEILVYARSPALLIHSTWGKLLGIKLLAMCGVLILGWYNWKIVTPALADPAGTGAAKLHRAVRIELGLGIVMLAITALLVATALPGET